MPGTLTPQDPTSPPRGPPGGPMPGRRSVPDEASTSCAPGGGELSRYVTVAGTTDPGREFRRGRPVGIRVFGGAPYRSRLVARGSLVTPVGRSGSRVAPLPARGSLRSPLAHSAALPAVAPPAARPSGGLPCSRLTPFAGRTSFCRALARFAREDTVRTFGGAPCGRAARRSTARRSPVRGAPLGRASRLAMRRPGFEPGP